MNTNLISCMFFFFFNKKWVSCIVVFWTTGLYPFLENQQPRKIIKTSVCLKTFYFIYCVIPFLFLFGCERVLKI